MLPRYVINRVVVVMRITNYRDRVEVKGEISECCGAILWIFGVFKIVARLGHSSPCSEMLGFRAILNG